MDELAVLTGEELMNFINHMQLARGVVTARKLDRTLNAKRRDDAADLEYEIAPLIEDAMLAEKAARLLPLHARADRRDSRVDSRAVNRAGANRKHPGRDTGGGMGDRV